MVDGNGLHPTKEKIHEAPQPQNVCKLRSLLGIVSYYDKFLRTATVFITYLFAQQTTPCKHNVWVANLYPRVAVNKLVTYQVL